MKNFEIKMKKILVCTLAGAMIFSTPVLAANSPSAGSVSGSGSPSASAVSEGGGGSWEDDIPGIPAATVVGAAAEGKNVGEYMNNAITELPGLDEVTPLGQGGQVIINGAPSNQVFATLKPTIAEVSLAKAQAVTVGGKVLNVARIKAGISFETASVNFYMPGIKAGQNIQVYQLSDGQWSQLTVTEIREDHVVVSMTSNGTLAFFEVAAN